MASMDPEDNCDDRTIGLQLQQFMDEWYYRCLHSGLASDWDREACASAALNLFEHLGVPLSDEERELFPTLDDDDMVEVLTKKMPMDVRKAFEHVALQLQLVMSAASRVRFTLKEGTPEELGRIMDEGDQSFNSHILKRTIMEAALEASESKEVAGSWKQTMNARSTRLNNAQLASDKAKIELDKLNMQLENFGTNQNTKSKNVLLNMSAQNDKVFLGTIFKQWWTWKVKIYAEKDIHDKFRKEIDDAQRKLMEYKQKQVSNIRNVLQMNSEGNSKWLITESFRLWAKEVVDQKEEKAISGTLEAAKNKMSTLKANQKDNARKTMARLAGGNEESLKTVTFQAWLKDFQDYMKDKEFHDAVREQEERVANFMKSQNENAKGVLSRVSSGSEAGMLKTAMSSWIEWYLEEKQKQEMDDMINSNAHKMKSLNSNFKETAKATQERANEIEEENILMALFMNWATEAKLGRLVKHYGGQIDAKRQQLDAVRSMFTSFATQLEQGITVSPRSQKKSGQHRSSRDREQKPPLPAA